MKRFIILLVVSVILLPSAVWASTLSSERLRLFSRVQAMSHGYYSPAEWDAIFERVSELQSRAEREGNREEIVELSILEAAILRDMRRDPDQALTVLEHIRERYYGEPVRNFKRIYLEMARTFAGTGDEAAIGDLIEEFKTSPYFDPVQYPFSGGRGREVPLAVTRPHAAGEDSITVSTLERYRTQARYAPGGYMPEIEGVDRAGRRVRLSDWRGHVVLVDFWIPGFVAWERDAPHLAALHRQYASHGFVILGVPLSRQEQQINAALRRHGMTWPQIRVAPDVPGQFGIFGDARNFLIDRNGMIVGRDLRGSNLAEALRAMLR